MVPAKLFYYWLWAIRVKLQPYSCASTDTENTKAKRGAHMHGKALQNLTIPRLLETLINTVFSPLQKIKPKNQNKINQTSTKPFFFSIDEI